MYYLSLGPFPTLFQIAILFKKAETRSFFQCQRERGQITAPIDLLFGIIWPETFSSLFHNVGVADSNEKGKLTACVTNVYHTLIIIHSAVSFERMNGRCEIGL